MTTYPNAPFQPGVTQDAFVPDLLIGGDLKIVTRDATITGGAFVRGTVLGMTADGKYTGATAAAADGSASPAAILADDVDASAADAIGGLYVRGEFDERAVTIGAGLTLDTIRAALETRSIFLKPAIPAANPS